MTYRINVHFLLTGDTLFIDGVGRTDLKAGEQEARARATALHDSLQELLNGADDQFVLPGHVGQPVPFDGKPIGATLKEIKTRVAFLHLPPEEFVVRLLAKLPPTPPNYLRIVAVNRKCLYNRVYHSPYLRKWAIKR